MKYLILGVAPSGLMFANVLNQNGEQDFLVLDHESEAGGLCRSVEVDGYPFDIGGNSVALHVRRGDHMYDNEELFRREYFKRVVNYINRRIS